MDSLGNLLHSRSSSLSLPHLPDVPTTAPAPAPDMTAPTPAPAPQPTDRIAHLRTLVREIEERLALVRDILANAPHEAPALPQGTTTPPPSRPAEFTAHEGVFNGEAMIAADGQTYPVPANYASKSKLVEGDLLKVTVLPTGELMYKQIGPVERDRKMGRLVKQEDGTFTVATENAEYRVLLAAVTYHRGAHGHSAVVLVPRDSYSAWAAIEYIFHQP